MGHPHKGLEDSQGLGRHQDVDGYNNTGLREKVQLEIENRRGLRFKCDDIGYYRKSDVLDLI